MANCHNFFDWGENMRRELSPEGDGGLVSDTKCCFDNVVSSDIVVFEISHESSSLTYEFKETES